MSLERREGYGEVKNAGTDDGWARCPPYGAAWTLVGAAIGAAFLGSFMGAKLVQKVTLRRVQTTCAGLLIILAHLIVAGLV